MFCCNDYHAYDPSFIYVISYEDPVESHKMLLLEAYRKKFQLVQMAPFMYKEVPYLVGG